jgi:hypothetical protein
MPIETRKSCLMERTGHEKSRDNVPLSCSSTLFSVLFFMIDSIWRWDHTLNFVQIQLRLRREIKEIDR